MPIAEAAMQQFSVVLLVDSEVLRRGLNSLLAQIPQVTSVTEWPEDWSGHVKAEARIVLATPQQWRRCAEEGLFDTDRDRPFVLLVGDDVRSREISLHGDLPCDGVISLADATARSIETALHRVVAGEIPMPARLARELLASSRGKVHRSAAGLSVAFTARKKETLGLLAQGFSNKQIAKALGISSHGVKRLVGAVLLKLGAPNRTTAVIMAINEGIV
ncbi:LuxR C-terminal-related transcriptional regulator [Streptomyces sp. TS71-3]|uniref:helix-turn-helix transcriptional regulator n=1 Tax=Streptomyces sp. TS71-3 TaxID=2733862 RepID=UPI001B2E3D1D|nr:LuxR C-terminal-related transcriptional regulator [Streptomyces sp. TS71-3]GHJ42564.1 hypothetical protein Sm713_81730 [Streptomyces sp. TS71-3]